MMNDKAKKGGIAARAIVFYKRSCKRDEVW